MEFLPMIDYIFNSLESVSKSGELGEAEASLNDIKEYATLLNQPLKLGMFIPCDLKGRIITHGCEDPKNMTSSRLNKVELNEIIKEHGLDTAWLDFKEARKKVLFKGFDVVSTPWSKDLKCQIFNKDLSFHIGMYNDFLRFESKHGILINTVGDLVNIMKLTINKN